MVLFGWAVWHGVFMCVTWLIQAYSCAWHGLFIYVFTPCRRTTHSLQHAAAYCNTLQHTVTHCNTLRRTAPRCTRLHHAATLIHLCDMTHSCICTPLRMRNWLMAAHIWKPKMTRMIFERRNLSVVLFSFLTVIFVGVLCWTIKLFSREWSWNGKNSELSVCNTNVKKHLKLKNL